MSTLPRTRIVSACLAFTIACSASGASIDDAAREYVRLARAAGRHDRAYRDEIAAALRTVAGFASAESRGAFLLAQLAALDRQAAVLAGEPRSIRDEAAMLGLPIPRYDAALAAGLRRQLDAALEGSAALPRKLAAHRRAAAVPRSRLDAVATAAVEYCRARTPLPSGTIDGGIELRYVVDRPWPAYTTYQGNGRSLVEIRRDVAWLEEDLLTVVCHETYPGHHFQHLIWEAVQRVHGWVELTVVPPFTPQAIAAERAAIAGTRLIRPDRERPAVSRILDALAPLALATAIDVVDGRLPRPEGLARLRDELLMPDAEGFLSFVERYRSMAVAYVTPLAGVSDLDEYVALLRSPTGLIRIQPVQ